MDLPQLLDSLADLAWPLLAALIFGLLYRPLRRVIQSRGFTIKVGDMQISVQEASNQLRKQVEDLQERVAEQRAAQSGDQGGTGSDQAPAGTRVSIAAALSVLWVDDNPANNVFEVARLRDAGIQVSLASTTDEGLRAVARRTFGAIITDMGREEYGDYNPDAGLELIRRLRESGVESPIAVYTNAAAVPKTKAPAVAAGANAVTGSPVELFAFLKREGIDAA